MQKQNSIFVKTTKTNRTILSKNDLYKTIPDNCVNVKCKQMNDTFIEWRWRFYVINGHSFIEISKKSPGCNRLFMDYSGKWIEYKLDKTIKNSIVDKKYYYSEK